MTGEQPPVRVRFHAVVTRRGVQNPAYRQIEMAISPEEDVVENFTEIPVEVTEVEVIEYTDKWGTKKVLHLVETKEQAMARAKKLGVKSFRPAMWQAGFVVEVKVPSEDLFD